MKRIFLGLGTNLGDRRQNLADAIERMKAPDLRVLRESSIYETAPRDVLDQPWFLNLVIEAETDLFPRQLQKRLAKIEREMGRKPSVPKGPRLIDIDILLFGESIVRTEDLEIPHPRIGERRFVLEPLAELAPDLRHPVTRRTMREMLVGVSEQVTKKLGRE